MFSMIQHDAAIRMMTERPSSAESLTAPGGTASAHGLEDLLEPIVADR
jgi:hypothetical protein